MKIKSLIVVSLYSVVTLIVLSNCSGKKEEMNHDAQHEEQASAVSEEPIMTASAPQFQVEESFQKQLSSLFTAYVGLKDAFISSDAAKVKIAVAGVQQAFTAVDMKLLSGAAHNDWMTYSDGLEGALKEILASDDIETQRSSFSKLSDSMYKSIKAYGLGGESAFYEYCPMAFNNQGAYWLSDNSEVLNPYFGDKMLKCGSVEEKLQ
jgi:Cu(I)/Ag(I) efflux system membrane fusion protein